MSCGISSRFQLLSPSQSQVAHVLLTRPPLTYSEQAPNKSVRLACVKRAASVRPEPGSNSLINCIFTPDLSVKCQYQVCSALTLTFQSSFSRIFLNSSKEFQGYVFCIVQFSRNLLCQPLSE